MHNPLLDSFFNVYRLSLQQEASALTKYNQDTPGKRKRMLALYLRNQEQLCHEYLKYIQGIREGNVPITSQDLMYAYKAIHAESLELQQPVTPTYPESE